MHILSSQRSKKMIHLNRRTRRLSSKRTSASNYFNVNLDPISHRHNPFPSSKIFFSILFSVSVTLSSSNNYAKKSQNLNDAKNKIRIEISDSTKDLAITRIQRGIFL